MKVATIYDLAKMYLPSLNKKVFTIMYNEALAKITQELRVDMVKETITTSDFPDMAEKIVKVISVSVDGTPISRVIKR